MANVKFNNLTEIKKYLNNKTKKALEETLKEMEKELKEEIFTDVYDAWDSEFYNTKRTYWLVRQGVEHYIVSLYDNKIAGGVRINTHKGYPVDLENYRHGNVYTGKFEPENFIEMLNNKANDGYSWYNAWHFPILRRKPFWDEFQEWANKHYATIFHEKCEELGIKLEETSSSNSKISKSFDDGWDEYSNNNAWSSYDSDLSFLNNSFGFNY